MATKEEILDAISNMTVLELSELLKDFEEKFGVTAAAPAAVMAAPAAGGCARGSEARDGDDTRAEARDGVHRVSTEPELSTRKPPAGVELYTRRHFVTSHLGCDPQDDIDWLLLTGQSVLEVIAGPL